jgi:glycosyltransferase involved in cell wall biosynthesis
MQIVLSYGEYPSTTGEFLARAFRRMGHEVHILALQKFRRAKPNIAFRYLQRNVPLVSWVDARRWIRWHKFQPDLFLWVESPRFLEVKVRKPFPCPTACYVIDTHMRAAELRSLARQYDTVFVAQRDDAKAFASEGLNAQWLPLGADPEIHAPAVVQTEFDVGFVGYIEAARYKERFELLRGLSQEFKVHVAKAYGREMAEAYCRCRVGFNKSLKGDVNMRVFEVMCMGLPLLTDRIGNGLGELFVEGKHFVGYDGAEELHKQVRALLADTAMRARVGAAGRNEIIRAHTYDHRAKTIIERSLRAG